MAEHTPVPWRVVPGTDYLRVTPLLVAAPALLAACEALDELDWCIGHELVGTNQERLDRALDLARAAIAAARPPT